ncbi:MAG: CvpA family protein [Terriglobales bacterium]
MGVADWIILAFLLFSVATAAWEGFFREAFGLAGLVAGYLLAAWQYRRLADWLDPILKQPWLGEVGSFLIIFFGVMIAAWLAGRLAKWLMKEAGLTALDRALGALLGLVRGSLVVAIVLVAMAAFAPAARWLGGSHLAPYFLVAGRAAVWLAPAELRHRFDEGLDYVRKAHSATQPPAAPAK